MRVPLIINTSILAALGYFNNLAVFAQPFYQPPQSTTVITTHGPSMGLVEELTGWSSQLSGIIKASPRCWTIAINALEDLLHVPAQSSTEFCAAMTQMQLDILAIELARCHTEKSGKPFIADGDNISAEDCEPDSLTDEAKVNACLAHLDTPSYDRYVHFTMHVQQLCVRFTDELVAAKKEQAALLLAHSSNVVGQQLQHLVEKNNELIKLLDDQMQEFSDKFDEMQDGVSHTTNNFHSIETIIGRVTRGYSWFMSLIHFLVALNIVWLLTMNKRARNARTRLINLVMVEASYEIYTHWGVYYNRFSVEKQVEYLSNWRRVFMVVELCFYIYCLVRSSCFDDKEDTETGEESTAIMKAVKATQAEMQAQMVEQMNIERAEARKQMEEHGRMMAEMYMNHRPQDAFEAMRARQLQNQQNSELQLQHYHHHHQYQRSRSRPQSPTRHKDSFYPGNHRLHVVADVAPTIGSGSTETNYVPLSSKPTTETPNLLSAAVYHHDASTDSNGSDTQISDAVTGAEDAPETRRMRKRKAKEHTEGKIPSLKANTVSESGPRIVVKSDPDEAIANSGPSTKKKKRSTRRG